MMKNHTKRYSEMIQLSSFEDRFDYLNLVGSVGKSTFGFDRYLNQRFYRSSEWKKVRDQVILRDAGCDLGIKDRPIYSRIIIHHMNPLRIEDIADCTEYLMNPEYLVCVSHETHNAIHYGDITALPSSTIVERKKNDTCPWKK